MSSHSGGLGPITSIGGTVGTATFSSGPGRLSHTPTSADFQPPYFPPPYNLPQQQSDFHHAHVNAVVAAAADPYSHLNSLAATPQQYHQLHPAQAARGHNVLSRRDEENLHLQSHMHSGLPTSVYGDGGASVAATVSAARRNASDMVYASVRRPDVLMHGGHHISEQDLLNLHNAGALSAIDDGQVRISARVAHTSHSYARQRASARAREHLSKEPKRVSAIKCESRTAKWPKWCRTACDRAGNIWQGDLG